MKGILASVCLFSISVYAAPATYNLKMDLALNGKAVSSPQVIVTEGEMATVTQEKDGVKSFIDVVATDATEKDFKGIMIKFTVGYVGKDGKRTIVSKPQILAKENSPAKIQVGQAGKESVSLTVLAQRQAE